MPLDTNTAAQLSTDLMRDYNLTPEQASGIVGNLAHESDGFNAFHEYGQPAGQGGYGYAQWTNDRADAFFNYAQEHGLDPHSYQANYGYLTYELDNTTVGQRGLAAVRNTDNVDDATRVFMNTFERPRTDAAHLDSRVSYANQANALIPPGYVPGAAPTPATMPAGLRTTDTDLGAFPMHGALDLFNNPLTPESMVSDRIGSYPTQAQLDGYLGAQLPPPSYGGPDLASNLALNPVYGSAPLPFDARYDPNVGAMVLSDSPQTPYTSSPPASGLDWASLYGQPDIHSELANAAGRVNDTANAPQPSGIDWTSVYGGPSTTITSPTSNPGIYLTDGGLAGTASMPPGARPDVTIPDLGSYDTSPVNYDSTGYAPSYDALNDFAGSGSHADPGQTYYGSPTEIPGLVEGLADTGAVTYHDTSAPAPTTGSSQPVAQYIERTTQVPVYETKNISRPAPGPMTGQGVASKVGSGIIGGVAAHMIGKPIAPPPQMITVPTKVQVGTKTVTTRVPNPAYHAPAAPSAPHVAAPGNGGGGGGGGGVIYGSATGNPYSVGQTYQAGAYNYVANPDGTFTNVGQVHPDLSPAEAYSAANAGFDSHPGGSDALAGVPGDPYASSISPDPYAGMGDFTY